MKQPIRREKSLRPRLILNTRLILTLLLTAGLLAACGSPLTEPTNPTDPSASPVTLSEPAVCADVSGDCTLMMSDGALTLAGTVNVPVTSVRYTVQGSADEVISADNPVTLDGDTFTVDLSDLAMGGYTLTLRLETESGETLSVTIVIVVNPSSGAFTPDERTVYVSNNGPGNAGLIDTFDETFTLQSTFNAGNNEGVEVDSSGNVYQAGDGENGPSIRVVSQLYDRPENASTFDPDIDREISGDATGLAAPKGIELAEDAGLLIVADFGDGSLKVFGASVDGNVAPVATTTLDTPAWDVAYDPNTDRLFAAITDGTVAVFDSYLEDYGADGPARTITPYRDGEKISDNLHGIAYDSGSDTLVVTDVGAATTPEQPGFKTDGSIYAFLGASTLDGNADPERVVRGRWTLLGNPVDVIFNGYDEVRITEKANDVLLVFDDFFAPDAPDGEVMPDLVKPESKPESLVAAPEDFVPDQNPNPSPEPGGGFNSDFDLNIYGSNNGPDNVGELDTFNALFQRLKTFQSGNNEGVDLDALGNLYHAGDRESGSSLRVLSQIRNRPDGGAYDATLDREIKGDSTGLVAPKGFDIAQKAGLLIVADFGDSNVKVFGTAAGGNVAPLAVTGFTVAPWDLAYDEANDRLFVARVNGTVCVFEDYVASGYGPDGPVTVLTPVDENGDKLSDNLHGVAYDAERDALVVTDVGAATTSDQDGFDSDGSLYVFENASEARGETQPVRILRGPSTLLGNPVDLILNGDEARIAEKAGDKFLVFDNVFDGASGDVAPDLAVDESKPESLVAEAADFALGNPDVTDIDDTATVIDALFAVSNTPESGDDFVVSVEPDLSTMESTFDTAGATVNPENITFSGNGDAYLTFDDGATPSMGGIAVVNRLATQRDGGTFDASRDRTITGDNTGLVAPKGLEVVDSLGVVIVADFGAKDIKVFSTQVGGNASPRFTTTNLGSDTRSVWDVDYDPTSDTLFVAGTDGTALVYEDYTADYGAGGPDREITPTRAGNKVSANLHGVVHVADKDLLILADVGAATTPDQPDFDADGELYVLTDASSADGNAEPVARVRGSNTTLGNPVDITFDGDTLFVAEKTKDRVLAFAGLLDYGEGDWNIRPSASAEVDNAESVALAPEFLSR